MSILSSMRNHLGWRASAWAAALFIFVAATASARSQDAVFKQSLEYFRKKDYAASRDLLLKLVKDLPGNALYWFNLGNTHYMLGKFRDAESCFAEVEKLRSPLAPAAKYYRSKALRAQGSVSQARGLLDELERSASLPASIREGVLREKTELADDEDLRLKNSALANYHDQRYEAALGDISAVQRADDDSLLLKGLSLIALHRAQEAESVLNGLRDKTDSDDDRRALLKRLDERLRRGDEPSQPSWAFIDAMTGINSNVYPDDEEARAALQSRLSVGAGLRAWRNHVWILSLQMRSDWSETSGLGDLKTLANHAQASLQRDTPLGTLQLSAIGEYHFWANEPVMARTGFRTRLKKSAGGYDLSADFGVLRTTPQMSQNDYLGGQSTLIRLQVGRSIFPVYIQIELESERQGLGDQAFGDGSLLPVAFIGWGPSLRVAWRHSDEWTVSALVFHQVRDYFTPAQPGGKFRVDRETAVAASLTRTFSPRLSGYLSVALVNNRSTLESSDVRNENYAIRTAQTGFLYEFR